MEKLLPVVIGAILGFLMPYGAKAWEDVTRSRRMRAALESELGAILREFQDKIKWVENDVSHHMDEVDPTRTVKTEDGKVLYLGLKEEFSVSRGYWKKNYTKIAETIDAKDYARFFRMYRLVDSFETKFSEMKQTFDCTYGKKEKMALACFDDLKKIEKELDGLLKGQIQPTS